MFVKDRRGGRNWAPGVFATFWILLAAFSAAYLFRIVSEPIPSQSAAASTPASDEETAAVNADGQTQEIAVLKDSLRDLSQQVAELKARIKPLERLVGPVAMATPGGVVTPSPPSPEPMLPPERPADLVKAPEKPAAAKPEAKVPDKPAEAAKPEKPVEEAKTPEKPATKTAEKPLQEAKAEIPAPAKPEAKPEPEPSEALPPAVVVAPEEKPAEKPAVVAAREEKPAEKPAEPGQLSSNEPTAIPTPGPSPSASMPAEGVETANLTPPTSIPPGTTRFGIEIGSVEKQDGLRGLWRDLLTNHAALVAGLEARRVLAPDKKWRLVAGPFGNADEATQACGLFKKANLPCEATVFAGDQL